jgi:hypothetical protein
MLSIHNVTSVLSLTLFEPNSLKLFGSTNPKNRLLLVDLKAACPFI